MFWLFLHNLAGGSRFCRWSSKSPPAWVGRIGRQGKKYPQPLLTQKHARGKPEVHIVRTVDENAWLLLHHSSGFQNISGVFGKVLYGVRPGARRRKGNNPCTEPPSRPTSLYHTLRRDRQKPTSPCLRFDAQHGGEMRDPRSAGGPCLL